MKRLACIVVFAAALLLGLFWTRTRDNDSAQAVSAAPTPAAPIVRNTPASMEFPRPTIPPPLETAHLADDLNSARTDIRADLRLVTELLDAFRTNFPRDGNPVGENAEITAALAGKNPLRFAFIAPTHRAINARGELCDRWGTPFFFHAESGTLMKIRSAGPDKKNVDGRRRHAGPVGQRIAARQAGLQPVSPTERAVIY